VKKTKLRFLASLMFCATALVASAQTNKIKVLIVEGVSNHDWRHRVEIVRTILDKDGSFDVDVTITPSAAGDPAWTKWRPNFSAYDVVLSGYNNLGGKPSWPAEVQAAFQSYVGSGGGFYVYHEANNSFAEWPEYSNLIGLGWRAANQGDAIIVNPDESLQIVPSGIGPDTSHGLRTNALIKRRITHPIHNGLPMSWRAADIEIYRYARGPGPNMPNVTVLSYALDPTTQLQFPIEWVVKYGNGHSYASSYGHVWAEQAKPDGTRCAAFQTIMVRALKWLAGRDPGNTTPTDFPGTTSTSLREYEGGESGAD